MKLTNFCKLLKWKLSATTDTCPFCGLKLIPHHNYDSFSDDYIYTCPTTDCLFNESKVQK